MATATAAAPVKAAGVAVPWYLWCVTLAVTSGIIGGHWDISWHRSIGRDTFWTPAHIAIYMCAVLAGIACGYLILNTTFRGTREARERSVTIWGFRGPLGAFMAAWGGIAMLTSAPFDDWWHSAYGLDVKVLSPPHVLLISGMFAIEVGALILVLGAMNRAAGEARRRLNGLFLYIGAVILVMLLILIMEEIYRVYMHAGAFYRVVALAIPWLLAALARASGHRWATTIVTGFYTLFLASLVWILPLFPAEPKLGPVYRETHQFMPPEFPLLLIVPAIVLDIVWRKTAGWKPWPQALVAGLLFLASFFAVQWPFATFLQSPAARKPFFGTKYLDANLSPATYYARYLFVPLEKTAAEFSWNMAWAAALSVLTVRLGLGWGEWMRRIRR
jgi:hypothetical protein